MIRCSHGIAAAHLPTSECVQERMLVEFDNARVLITDMKIESIKDIIPILEQISRLNQPLLIIAVRAIPVGSSSASDLQPGPDVLHVHALFAPMQLDAHLVVTCRDLRKEHARQRHPPPQPVANRQTETDHGAG